MRQFAIASDKSNKQFQHYFYPIRHGDGYNVQEKVHEFKGTTCWCKPAVTTDWSKMQTRAPYVFIYHQKHG